MRNPSDHYLQIINADFDTVKSTLKALEVDVSEQTFLSCMKRYVPPVFALYVVEWNIILWLLNLV